MTLKVLRRAREDLRLGIEFYNSQQKGLGSCFYDSLISDIESLQIYAGIHIQLKTTTEHSQSVFLIQSIIK